MAATGSLKKFTLHGRMVAQADPSKEASTVKKMNGRLLLLSSNKMTHYSREWATASGVLKKIY